MKTFNKVMIKSAMTVAKTTKAKTLFLFVDALDELAIPEAMPKNCELMLVSQRNGGDLAEIETLAKKVIRVPAINLGRVGLVKLTVALALSQQLLAEGDRIVFLSGTTEHLLLDTLLVLEIGKEAELITSKNIAGISESVKPEVFERVLSIALELASKGREGKPVGTIFVVGDHERVMQLSKQMIINPFKGYDETERNIMNPYLKETLREFAALD